MDKNKKPKYNKNELTDNVRFNEIMSPGFFLLQVYLIHSIYGLNILQNFFSSSFFYAFVSTLVYLFATNYFQPDLDIMYNRPGMKHFPFGRWVGTYKIGRFFKWIAYPINRAWYYLWHPYGNLLTHRGVGHWPIIGVWLRIGYLYLICGTINYLLELSSLNLNIRFLFTFFDSFYPWTKNFANFYFLLFSFPIYLSDMVHIAVDFYDAKKRSMSFCPPRIPRGLIIKTINTLRGLR